MRNLHDPGHEPTLTCFADLKNVMYCLAVAFCLHFPHVTFPTGSLFHVML